MDQGASPCFPLQQFAVQLPFVRFVLQKTYMRNSKARRFLSSGLWYEMKASTPIDVQNVADSNMCRFGNSPRVTRHALRSVPSLGRGRACSLTPSPRRFLDAWYLRCTASKEDNSRSFASLSARKPIEELRVLLTSSLDDFKLGKSNQDARRHRLWTVASNAI